MVLTAGVESTTSSVVTPWRKQSAQVLGAGREISLAVMFMSTLIVWTAMQVTICMGKFVLNHKFRHRYVVLSHRYVVLSCLELEAHCISSFHV